MDEVQSALRAPGPAHRRRSAGRGAQRAGRVRCRLPARRQQPMDAGRQHPARPGHLPGHARPHAARHARDGVRARDRARGRRRPARGLHARLRGCALRAGRQLDGRVDRSVSGHQRHRRLRDDRRRLLVRLAADDPPSAAVGPASPGGHRGRARGQRLCSDAARGHRRDPGGRSRAPRAHGRRDRRDLRDLRRDPAPDHRVTVSVIRSESVPSVIVSTSSPGSRTKRSSSSQKPSSSAAQLERHGRRRRRQRSPPVGSRAAAAPAGRARRPDRTGRPARRRRRRGRRRCAPWPTT